MVSIKFKKGDFWHYDECVVLDGNLVDEFSFNGHQLDEDVNRMCLHVIESLVKGIGDQR